MSKFKKGQRVKLKANEQEGWPEEQGMIVGLDGEDDLYVVRVDTKYRMTHDDGFRGGITVDQLVSL